MCKQSGLGWIALILVIVGGLNWGLVGLLDLNVVEYLGATLAMIVYIIVGLAALVKIYGMVKK